MNERFLYNQEKSERQSNKETIARRLARKLGSLANELSMRMNREKSGERLIKDYGIYDREKDSLQGLRSTRKSEDASYANSGEGVFGIFDGAGGVGEPGAGGMASKIAKESFARSIENGEIRSPEDLARYLNLASREVGRQTEGITTATVAKIVKEKDGRKYLYYASAGDSRIYVVHKGNIIKKGWAEQVTVDEGVRNEISNWLGRENRPIAHDEAGNAIAYVKQNVTQTGRILIRPGDKIVLCSDGITGDVNRRMEDGRNELMGEDELASIVNRAGHVQSAARALVEQARKKDDRSAIVVEV